MISLVMNPGRPDEQQFRLAQGTATIGRTKDNAVFCLHKSLSRRHAQIDFDGVRLRITDLQSKNGIFFHGKRVRECEVLQGDSFRCGDIVFLVEAATTQSPELRNSDRAIQTLQSPVIGLQGPSPRPPPPPAPAAAPDDRHYKEKLFLLVRLTEVCVSGLPIGDVLHEIVMLSAQVLETDRLTLLTLDERTLEMKPVATKSSAPHVRFPYSARVVNWVVDHGNPASFVDVSRDRTLPGDVLADAVVRGAMCAPINPGGGTIGVLYADSLTHTDCFRPDDLALLRALANLAAIAIESAALRRGQR